MGADLQRIQNYANMRWELSENDTKKRLKSSQNRSKTVPKAFQDPSQIASFCWITLITIFVVYFFNRFSTSESMKNRWKIKQKINQTAQQPT